MNHFYNRGSQPKPSFATVTGRGGTTQIIVNPTTTTTTATTTTTTKKKTTLQLPMGSMGICLPTLIPFKNQPFRDDFRLFQEGYITLAPSFQPLSTSNPSRCSPDLFSHVSRPRIKATDNSRGQCRWWWPVWKVYVKQPQWNLPENAEMSFENGTMTQKERRIVFQFQHFSGVKSLLVFGGGFLRQNVIGRVWLLKIKIVDGWMDGETGRQRDREREGQ